MNWTLSDEIGFIRDLGTHRQGKAIRGDGRIALIKGYVLGLDVRWRADGLDLEACRIAALTEIAHEERMLKASDIFRDFRGVA